MEFSNPVFTIILLGVACYILTFITRRIVETAAPSLKPKVITGADALKGTVHEGTEAAGGSEVFPTAISRWWNQVILYAMAPAWGVLGGCAFHGEKFYPEAFKSWLVTVIVGLASGFFSGFMVKLFKKIFLDKVGAADESSLPSAGPGQ